MIADLLIAIFTFALTVIFGGWLANRWQSNSSKDARFFDISKNNYESMIKVSQDITELLGKRIYSAQRICYNFDNPDAVSRAYEAYSVSLVLWNERLFSFELAIRTAFRHPRLDDFERLQAELASVSYLVLKVFRTGDYNLSQITLRKLEIVRGKFFYFVQGMLKEASLLNRQMHFGVAVPFARHHLDKLSTWEIFKNLILASEKPHCIVRSPSDFGVPVDIDDARFGVYEK